MNRHKSKSRGSKHRSNKKKYKKHKPVDVPPPKPVLESNHQFVEPKEPEISTTRGADFSILANAPISHGSHFQFKEDKNKESEVLGADDSKPVTDSFFDLDLLLLEKSLSTIPFNVRNGIKKEYFSENQQKIMSELFDKLVDYEKYLGNSKCKEIDILSSGLTDSEYELNERNTAYYYSSDDENETSISTSSPTTDDFFNSDYSYPSYDSDFD